MKCEEMKDEVWRIILEEADVSSQRLVQQHIQCCNICNTLYNSILKLNQELPNLSVRDLPDGFEQRFKSRLRERQQEASLKSWEKIILHLSNPEIRMAIIIFFAILISATTNLFVETSLEKITVENFNDTSIILTIGIMAIMKIIFSILKLIRYQL